MKTQIGYPIFFLLAGLFGVAMATMMVATIVFEVSFPIDPFRSIMWGGFTGYYVVPAVYLIVMTILCGLRAITGLPIGRTVISAMPEFLLNGITMWVWYFLYYWIDGLTWLFAIVAAVNLFIALVRFFRKEIPSSLP